MLRNKGKILHTKQKTRQNLKGRDKEDKIRSNKQKKTKKIINNYIFKKADICCEEDIEREKCINIILDNYKIIAKNNLSSESEYLDFLDNDLTVFIGYLSDLKKNKDKEGIKLWNYIDKEVHDNNNISLEKIKLFLNNVPLFFLMSLLGYSTYRINL